MAQVLDQQNDEDKVVDRSGLSDRENSPDNDASFSYTKGDSERQKLLGKKGRIKSATSAKRKKALLIAGAGTGAGMGTLFFLLIFLIGALLIPQLAEHITEYEFIRVVNQFGDNADRVTEERLGADTVDASDSAIDAEFTDANNPDSATLVNDFDNYSPSDTIGNLDADSSGTLKLNYTPDADIGHPILSSVEVDGVKGDVTPSALSDNIPQLSDAIHFDGDASFSGDFVPELNSSLETDNVGTIIRGPVAAGIREDLGIGLDAWSDEELDSLSGKTSIEAQEAVTKDIAEDTDQDLLPDNAVTNEIAAGDQAVDDQVTNAESTPALVKSDIIDTDAIIPGAETAADSALTSTVLSTLAGYANPLFKAALPLCIIYDGSLEKSGPGIDNATSQEQRAFYDIESSADQEKYGAPGVNAEAVGALNNDLNEDDNIADANAEVRSGGGVVNTTSAFNAESSADGENTILSATLGNLNITGAAEIASLMDRFGNALCPTLTNPAVALPTGLALLIATLPTGGEAELETAGAEAETAAEVVGTEIGTDLSAELAAQAAAEGTASTAENIAQPSLISRGVRLVWNIGKKSAGVVTSAGTISGLTLVAKGIVMARSAMIDSGTAQGVALANEADAGGNVDANELSRQLNYGRPLDSSEVVQSAQTDAKIEASNISKESTYNRYFALSNADSLFSRVGMSLYTHLNVSFLSSIIGRLGSVFNPISLISKVFASTDNSVALAQSTVDNSDYGNVQFGWSQSEENLINSSTSYMPLENQEVLNKASDINKMPAEEYISSIYSPCFTDSIGTLLSTTDSAQSNEQYIVRDDSGNVVDDQGVCSPDNLGPNNKTYGDLVFRWRLAMAYTNTLAQFDQESSLSN